MTVPRAEVEAMLRERFETWAKKWYIAIRPTEFSDGKSIDGVWIYNSSRLQHSWSGYRAAFDEGRRVQREEDAKIADRMQAAAGDFLAREHDPDASAQYDTAMEIAEAIRRGGEAEK